MTTLAEVKGLISSVFNNAQIDAAFEISEAYSYSVEMDKLQKKIGDQSILILLDDEQTPTKVFIHGKAFSIKKTCLTFTGSLHESLSKVATRVFENKDHTKAYCFSIPS